MFLPPSRMGYSPSPLLAPFFFTSWQEAKPQSFFAHFLFLAGFIEAGTFFLQCRLLTFLPCASRQKIRRVCFPFRPHLKMFFQCACFSWVFLLRTLPRRTRPMVRSPRDGRLSRREACSRACKAASQLCCTLLWRPPGNQMLEPLCSLRMSIMMMRMMTPLGQPIQRR